MLKLKNRENSPKKVLIFGHDKSGKSTYAEKYCLENNLKSIVIDIDDTNYTNLPIIDVELTNDIVTYRNMKETILEISNLEEYDTIMLDGVSSLLELLTPSSEKKDLGRRAYKMRADRFSSILQKLIKTNKNLIFIGQIDMQVIYNNDFQSPKPIIKINSIVNEKYLTYVEKGQYLTETLSSRGVEK